MQAQLYNSLTKKIEAVPVKPDGSLGFYACGITAYDFAHLGNLRRYVMDDVIIRTLRYFGYQVNFVQNVTDVGHLTSDADVGDDKLEKGAQRDGESVAQIAQKFQDYFYAVNDEIGNLRPDTIARASDYISQQLAIATDLEAKGFAYLIPGDGLYFDTSKDPDYGQLAGLPLAELQEGARVNKVAGKRNPTDFAIWKLEKPGENRQQVWPSPWGERSFPGWHLECVAISQTHLGPQYQIHSGGIDHLTVHHPNEIAQAQAHTGQVPYVELWIHHNFMLIEGQKMSKSLGNIYRLEDINARGFTPSALRYLFLTTHYQKEMNFTWDSLAAAQKAYDRLVHNLARLGSEKTDSMAQQDNIDRAERLKAEFFQALANNLQTPQALVVIGEILKATLGKGERYDLVLELDNLLGLGLRQAVARHWQKEAQATAHPTLSSEAETLFQERETARANKDFARADFLRQELTKLGYQIQDTPAGAKLIKVL